MERWVRHVYPELVDETREVKTGFTRRQKEWFKRVYEVDGRTACHFPIYSEDRGWHICGCNEKLECHHIEPQGYSKRVENKDPDFMYNGIYLCREHHVAEGHQGDLNWRDEPVMAVHPDTEWARRNYLKRNKRSYNIVYEGRRDRTDQGLPYWNVEWDEILKEIAIHKISQYILENPDDKFPSKKR